MPVHDLASQRLFIDAPLAAGTTIACTPEQANYLRNVLRLGSGARLLVFNGTDGEWEAAVHPAGKRDVALETLRQIRPQHDGPDIAYLFAPLKRSRLDYMVQKATEMGVARLVPVITRHTVAERVNVARMRANVIEAAEQCGILRVPGVTPPEKLDRVIAGWPPARRLIFCDEAAVQSDPVATLTAIAPGPLAVLIGPEGGFAAEERALLGAQSFVVPISLGPRIMRADTAGVASLALVNAILGDWR